MENSTTNDIFVLEQIKLEWEPDHLLTIKQRGISKIVAYNDAKQEFTIFNEKLKLEVQVPSLISEVKGIIQQPLSMIYYSNSLIGFYQLVKNQVATSQSMCRSYVTDIDQVVYDIAAPGILIALSRRQNTLQLFEARGTGEHFECTTRGVLRLPLEYGKQLLNMHI